jgi:hypothetical protein
MYGALEAALLRGERDGVSLRRPSMDGERLVLGIDLVRL